jgi:cytochrome c-type biogenesis protein CcmF
VLIGTLYPLVLDALSLGKISVGPPYFNLAFGLVMVPLVLMMGLGQFARWKEDSLGRLTQGLFRFALGAGLIGALAIALLSPNDLGSTLGGVMLALWLVAGTAAGVWARIRDRRQRLHALFALPRGFVGQCLAHLGFAVTLAGVVLTSSQSVDLHTRLAPGSTVELGQYTVEFESLSEYEGPNYRATRGVFHIATQSGERYTLMPEKRFYQVRNMAMTEAGIEPGFTRDLYISLGEPLGDDGAWSVRLHVKAFVRWLWLGALMMALGGFLAISALTVRKRREAPQAAVAPTLP